LDLHSFVREVLGGGEVVGTIAVNLHLTGIEISYRG